LQKITKVFLAIALAIMSLIVGFLNLRYYFDLKIANGKIHLELNLSKIHIGSTHQHIADSDSSFADSPMSPINSPIPQIINLAIAFFLVFFGLIILAWHFTSLALRLIAMCQKLKKIKSI